jgi:type II secretory ATPase GspE/PulE/Tfp pilus assembly ATPase PilB-like protein
MPTRAQEAISRLQRRRDKTHCPQGHPYVVRAGRKKYCPVCKRQQSKEQQKQTQKRRRRKGRAIAFLGGKCKDCNQAFPGRPEVFDFDHVTGIKTSAISHLLSAASWATVLIELQKCELVCANCHRTRTKQRLDHKRVVGYNGL